MRLGLLEIFTLFCLSLGLFICGSSSQEVIGFDSRFYLFALEMFQNGMNWFPTTYQQLYPDYPATSTVLIYLLAKIFGNLNKLIAILPTAIVSAITLTLTYLIGALHNKRWGLSAVFFLLLTITFLKSARSITLDMNLVMITTACFYLIHSADLHQQPWRTRMIYPLLFLGFAFRGPIGLVIPTGVICIYYLLDGHFKKFFLSGFLALILLFLSTALLLLIAYLSGGLAFMHDVLHMQVLGRIDNIFLPPYFYFTHSLESYSLSYPLAWMVMLGVIYYAWRQHQYTPEIRFLIKLFGWMLIILIGMSIPGDKKIRYILPMTPAAALIVAYLFAVPHTQKYFLFIRQALMRIFLFFPAIFLVFITALLFYENKIGAPADIQYSKIMIVLFLLQLLSFIMFYRQTNQSSMREMYVLFCCSMAFVCAYILVAEPLTLRIDKARNFVVAIEKQRLQQNAQLVFYKEKPDGLPIKYLINIPRRVSPIFLQYQEELLSFPHPAFFITREEFFTHLPQEIAGKFHIIAKDKVAHKDVLVFARP